ncbi:ornithine carbamoyltransferase [Candidatus Daviesbacteria bacterium]|nr:ornithine carbamoyltransferase [Candidatus Daviesbacteria bacterium]
MIKEHFLSITDLSAKEIWQVFHMAKELKEELKSFGGNAPLLKDKNMVMLFEKPSLRTKLSFDIGISQLGGHAIYFSPQEVGLGQRELAADVAKVVSSMADLIVARVYSHTTLEELAQNSRAPVVNALSDLEHPCQALADLFTIWEVKRYQDLSGLVMAYVGDGENNVTHSLCLGAVMMNMEFRCGSPEGFWMNGQIVSKAESFGGKITETKDPQEAVAHADIVVADTWVSMGDTDEEVRKERFRPYQVNAALMSLAKPDAIFMHCLPAYRGKEVTAEVIDGPQSVVFQEAENRLHVQKSLLIWLLSRQLKHKLNNN